jgi:hypothetical protein
MPFTEKQFNTRLEAISGRQHAIDRELGQLFLESGWTQKQIATHLGKQQPWVSDHLRFAGFLGYIANCDIARRDNPYLTNLTEFVFRRHWRATKGCGTDEERFAAVAVNLENGVPPEPVKRNRKPKPVASAEPTDEERRRWRAAKKLLKRSEDVLTGFRDLVERNKPASATEIRKAAEPLALLLTDVKRMLMHYFGFRERSTT